MSIIIENLTVKYGELIAIDNLELRIPQGEVFGFIGPNGAGKTTTIKVMAALLMPTLGRVVIGGIDVVRDADRLKSRIGYMPDFFGVYDNLKVWEYLEFFGNVYGVDKDRINSKIDEVLDITKLEVKKDSFVEVLSRGMRQRLCLARLLIYDPDVFILDEPASGLDPKGRIEMREIIKGLQKAGKTVFISSHILSELADMCTSIGIIEKGHLIKAGNIHEIRKEMEATRELIIRVRDREKGMRLLEGNFQGMVAFSQEDGIFRARIVDDDIVAENLIKCLVDSGAGPISIHEEKTNLESLYLQLTKGSVI